MASDRRKALQRRMPPRSELQKIIDRGTEEVDPWLDEETKGPIMTAIEHLRRLVESGCDSTSGMHDDPVCFHCRGDYIDSDSRYAHAPDCPWVAAKGWLEEPKTIDSGAMTIGLLIDRLSALRDTHGDMPVWGNSEWEYAFTRVVFAEAGKDHYHGEMMPDRIEIT